MELASLAFVRRGENVCSSQPGSPELGDSLAPRLYSHICHNVLSKKQIYALPAVRWEETV